MSTARNNPPIPFRIPFWWDDDTNCQVTVTGFGLKGDMVELARELGAALTPASTK